MNTAEQLRGDILTVLLAYRIHQQEPTTIIMTKVMQCCERLLIKTYDAVMIETYCQIIKGIRARRYVDVKMMLHMTETNYYKVYMNVQ